jgi:hypothetical protein
MKKLISFLLTAVAVFTNTSTHAQKKWTVGYRTGLEFTNLSTHLDATTASENLRWTNQFYLARTIGKRFEIDANLRYSRKTYCDTFIVYDAPGPLEVDANHSTQITLQLNGRYKLLQKQHYALYAQLGTSVMCPIVTVETEYLNEPPGYEEPKYSHTHSSMDWINMISAGATIKYDLTPQFVLTGTVLIDYKTIGLAQRLNPEVDKIFGAQIQVGFGYRF